MMTDPRWRIGGGSPWPSSDAALRLAFDALPHVADDDACAVIVLLVGVVADLREELLAVRAAQSAALALAHDQHIELTRLRARLIEQRHGDRQEAA